MTPGLHREAVIMDAAYELGGLASQGGVHRGSFFNGVARALARATEVEGVGVTAHVASAIDPAVAIGLVGPWSESERSDFIEQTHWAPQDRVLASCLNAEPGAVFHRTAELVALEEYHHSRLFNEFQRPRGIGDQATMCLAAPDGGRLIVGIARVGSEAPISDTSLDIAQRIAPLIERCWLCAHHRLPEWVRQLTPRRRRVLELVADGLDDHQIAQEMGVRYHTVRAHLKDLFRVAGVRSRLHLMQELHDGDSTIGQPEMNGLPVEV